MLEVGSAADDVALLAAELVGPTGIVIGVDNRPAILQIARTRAQAARFTQVSFVEGDLTDLAFSEDFDAVVGRYILHHVRDQVLVLRQLVGSQTGYESTFDLGEWMRREKTGLAHPFKLKPLAHV